jgi:hypothetical protein
MSKEINSIKEPEEAVPEQVAPESRPRSTARARQLIRFLNVFGIFRRDQVVQLMPFILFVSVLILFYIANSYTAERTVRNIDKIKKELKENRAEFISVKSEMMYRSQQSAVARAVAPLELKESTDPPKKIVVNSEKSEK